MQRMRLKLPIVLMAAGLTAAILLAIAVALAAGEGTTATTNPRLQDAERLVIRYSASGFELVSRTALLKVLPPTVALPATKGAVSGSWFEAPDWPVWGRHRIPESASERMTDADSANC